MKNVVDHRGFAVFDCEHFRINAARESDEEIRPTCSSSNTSNRILPNSLPYVPIAKARSSQVLRSESSKEDSFADRVDTSTDETDARPALPFDRNLSSLTITDSPERTPQPPCTQFSPALKDWTGEQLDSVPFLSGPITPASSTRIFEYDNVSPLSQSHGDLLGPEIPPPTPLAPDFIPQPHTENASHSISHWRRGWLCQAPQGYAQLRSRHLPCGCACIMDLSFTIVGVVKSLWCEHTTSGLPGDNLVHMGLIGGTDGYNIPITAPSRQC